MGVQIGAGGPDSNAGEVGARPPAGLPLFGVTRRRVGGVVGACLIGLFVGLTLFVGDHIENRALHAAIETSAALIAALAAYLTYGRFIRTGERIDAVLLCSMSLLAGTNLFFAALPALFPAEMGPVVHSWVEPTGTLFGSFALAVTAFTPPRVVADARETARRTVLLSLLCLAVVSLATLAVPPPSSVTILGTNGGLLTNLLSSVFFFVAGVGFLGRTDHGNELARWLEVGAVLAGFARLNHYLFPIPSPGLVSAGDTLRLGFYVLLAAGAAVEIRSYWEQLRLAAVVQERRRTARELHDGLAQELAFVVRLAQSLGHSYSDARLNRLTAATGRALVEARRAIRNLSTTDDESLDVVLARELEEIVDRTGTALGLNLAANVEVSPDVREALVRIACEAVTNAVQHSHARFISAELTNANGVSLEIADDGRGFAPDEVGAGGFGLTSMRERAEAVGARFSVISRPGSGTRIQVNAR